jgi:uncharacterized protein YycO
MKLKPGDILACWDNSWISKIIRFITRSQVSHIAIMYDDEMVIESWWNGVRIIKLSDLKKRSNFYVMRANDVSDLQIEYIIDFLQDVYSKSYDFIQLVTIGLHKIFGINVKNSNTNYICSELAWEAYNSVGIDIAPQIDSSDEVTPGDLQTSPALKMTNVYIKVKV